MNKKSRIGIGNRLLVMMAILSCWGVGCGFRHQPARGVKHISWSHSEGSNQGTAGIDNTAIDIFSWNDGAAFVIWSDGSSTHRGTSPRQPSDPRGSARYDGAIGDMKIECVTLDGLTGTVKIGSNSFDLTRGRLFLVATQEGKPRIQQMSLSKLDLKPDGNLTDEQVTLEHLRELAKTDADIREFFLQGTAQTESSGI
ncbi:MAG: hypothetical protein GX455_02440 [Phycisphaerae bacterium]|nr:hypothetical protein [Phycisphaerae bacterium]